MGTPEKLAEIAAQVRDGARAAGKDEASVQVVAKVRVSIDRDRERALEAAQLAAMYSVADHYRDMLASSGFEGEVAKASAAAAHGGLGAAAQTISDDYLESAAALRRHVDRRSARPPSPLRGVRRLADHRALRAGDGCADRRGAAVPRCVAHRQIPVMRKPDDLIL